LGIDIANPVPHDSQHGRRIPRPALERSTAMLAIIAATAAAAILARAVANRRTGPRVVPVDAPATLRDHRANRRAYR